MEKTIYDLDLHESIYLEKEEINIMRVASGWNYTYYIDKENEHHGYTYSAIHQIVFVPFDNSFQKVRK